MDFREEESFLNNEGFKIQRKRVYLAFLNEPLTMLEASLLTGVRRANICWYVDFLIDNDRIALIRKRKCSISGYFASEYTANRDLFPEDNQLNFDFIG